MEFLIAAGIAALGYKLSTSEARPVDPPTQLVKSNEILTTQDARKDEAQRAKTAFEASQDPYRTNVIQGNPNLQPFFRSARSQNTNDSVKSRLFDLFTGTLDSPNSGVYRKKVESSSRFQPLPQQISSSGSTGNPQCWDRQLPQAGLRQNNVRPTEQVRVGPGVCVGADVPAADGFHYGTCRIMPKNVGEYKKNQLEGRIIPGGAQNAMRPADPNATQNRPPRVWDINRRPPEPTMAAVTARTHRSEIGLQCVDDRIPGDEYFGQPAMRGHTVASDSREHTRNRSDLNSGLPLTNVTGARHGLGAFAHATYDTQRMDAQQREQAGFEGMLTGDHRRGTAPAGHIVPPTNRDMAAARSEGYMGGAAHMVPSGDNRPQDHFNTTLRQLTTGPADAGAAAPLLPAHMVQCTYKQLAKPAKRHTTTERAAGYLPMPERNNEFRRANVGEDDPWQVAGLCKGQFVSLKEKSEANRVLAHASSASMYTNMAPVGQSAATKNKLPEVNTRQDFGLAQQVLKENPYALSINS